MVTEFGKLLRIIRINSGDSLKSMAKKLNISPSYLSSIENGNRNIPIDIERQLSEVYPLTDVDREKLRKAMVGSSDSIKINLTDFAENKQRLIFAITQDSIPDETIDRMCDLAFRKEK